MTFALRKRVGDKNSTTITRDDFVKYNVPSTTPDGLELNYSKPKGKLTERKIQKMINMRK